MGFILNCKWFCVLVVIKLWFKVGVKFESWVCFYEVWSKNWGLKYLLFSIDNLYNMILIVVGVVVVISIIICLNFIVVYMVIV